MMNSAWEQVLPLILQLVKGDGVMCPFSHSAEAFMANLVWISKIGLKNLKKMTTFSRSRVVTHGDMIKLRPSRGVHRVSYHYSVISK
jgi:hypothetical protein